MRINVLDVDIGVGARKSGQLCWEGVVGTHQVGRRSNFMVEIGDRVSWGNCGITIDPGRGVSGFGWP